MYLLAIETSCDETAVALYHLEKGLINHKISSQINMHRKHGGVVPELASRDHIRCLLPMVDDLIKDINIKNISFISYTKGPGLIGALMVGTMLAKSLSYAWGIPAIGVNHLEGHLLAPMLEEEKPGFPHVALLVSGGHSQMILVKDFGKYELLGQSVDDAAGEAFDKSARLLGLGYPGGPAIQKLAQSGNETRFEFPRPMTKKAGFDFSFSGLKTHTAEIVRRKLKTEQDKADIAAGFESAVADTFRIKCKRALKETGVKTLVVAGGVSANKRLRATLVNLGKEMQVEVFFPRFEFCTDNAAMIACAAYQKYLRKEFDEGLMVKPKPRWPIEEL